MRVCSLTNNLALRMDECIGINDDDDSVKFKVSSDYKMRSWMGTWVLVLETPQLKLSRFARVCF